jgi:hypothetical protein
MFKFVVAVFFVLHGLVHLLYLGQSQRFFELQPGMVWPDGSWAFSRFAGTDGTRLLAAAFLLLAAVGFVVGGAGLFLEQGWWRPVIVTVAAFSAATLILFWDGGLQNLADRGAIGVLINLAILAAVLVFQWPAFEF